ncbi:MAG: hypothetical protein J1E97_05665 [Muribaculaceae bacterium]|nr:hypothetical protein [Muribaculaceae bacterium]
MIRKIFGVSLFLLCLSLPAFGHVTELDNGDYIYTFIPDCVDKSNAGNFNLTPPEYNTRKTFTTSQHRDAGKDDRVELFGQYYLHYRLGVYEFVFDAETSMDGKSDFLNKLVCVGFKENPMYIKSIAVEFSENDPKVGELWLHARADKTYEANLFTIEEYAEEADEEAFFSATAAGESRVQVYEFTKPVRYFALTREISQQTKGNYVRVCSISITYSATPPTGSSDGLLVQLGTGDEDEVVDTPFKPEGIMLADYVSFPEDEKATVADAGIKFYAIPQFESSEKPVAGGEKPENMTAQEWRFFNLFESEINDTAYDGWLDGADRIECEYNASDNSIYFQPPCSGLYSIHAESDEVEITSNDLAVNVWPDVRNLYYLVDDQDGEMKIGQYGFSLNSVLMKNDNGSYLYPYADKNYKEDGAYGKESVEISICGLFDAQVYYIIDGGHLPTEATRSSEVSLDGYTLYSPETAFNFNALTFESPSATLQIKVAKNGSLTPEIGSTGKSENTFPILLSDGKDIPTGIEKVSEACKVDCNARYLNLNGMEVQPGSSGIYIKIDSEGKASKVLVRP